MVNAFEKYTFSRDEKVECEENKSVIYMIRNLNNGKVYIGQSRNIRTRKFSHVSMLRSGRHNIKEMQADFNNGDCFEFSIIHTFPETVTNGYLNAVEWACIMEYNGFNSGYNSNLPNWDIEVGLEVANDFPKFHILKEHIKTIEIIHAMNRKRKK